MTFFLWCGCGAKQVVKSVVFVETMTEKDVDFVLVWDAKTDASRTEEAKERRKIFERNLEDEGLRLEREKIEGTDYNFVKIRAPIEVLRRYAEILKLRLPMKQVRDNPIQKLLRWKSNYFVASRFCHVIWFTQLSFLRPKPMSHFLLKSFNWKHFVSHVCAFSHHSCLSVHVVS